MSLQKLHTKELEVGMKIRLLKSGESFKIDKVFQGNIVDMTALEPRYPDIMPDFFDKLFSIQLVNFEIL